MIRVLRSSAFALAFAYVMLGIGALILFAVPLWYAWQATVQDGRAEILQIDAQRLTEVFRREGVHGLTSFINARVGMQIANERILLLADPSLSYLAGNLPAWPPGIPDEAGISTDVVNLKGHPTKVMFMRTALPGGYSLLVGRDSILFTPLETRFWYGLAGALGVLVVFGILGGVLVRRVLLQRIESIGQTVSAIMHGDLAHRLPVRGSDDELNTLSFTINRLLDQIEQLVHGVRNVSNAIAHDLRTPLAELRSRLEELVLMRPPASEVFPELEGAVADVDHVIGIFNALLRLAEIDAGSRHSGFIQVDMAKLASEVHEMYLPAAELKGIAISLHAPGPLLLMGDPLLLAQAIGNLVDNALKYTPDNGRIAMTAGHSDAAIDIVVADDGPGIPDAEKPKVTERFYRGDVSRGSSGTGLGLSLVAAVARLHDGIFELTDNHPGLRARVAFGHGMPPGGLGFHARSV